MQGRQLSSGVAPLLPIGPTACFLLSPPALRHTKCVSAVAEAAQKGVSANNDTGERNQRAGENNLRARQKN